MPVATPCYLVIHPPASGAWNMAVDEALLTCVPQTGVPVLRFYQWRRPTLSLGYFQKHTDRSLHPASEDADIVRRLSGGGAIMHDRELTYSLVLPKSHELSRNTQQLYNLVHRSIIHTLSDLLCDLPKQWEAVLCVQPHQLPASEEPFLCFQRRSKGDILLRNCGWESTTVVPKIVGSAQRRRPKGVLQHGSILLGQSAVAPELLGIVDLTKQAILPEQLLSTLPQCLAQALNLALVEYELPDKLLALAQQLEETKYSHSDWTLRR